MSRSFASSTGQNARISAAYDLGREDVTVVLRPGCPASSTRSASPDPPPSMRCVVRYHARWLLRIVGAGTGRLTDRDRRLTAAAVSLLTKGLP